MNQRNKNSLFELARIDVVLFLSSFIFHGLAFKEPVGIREYNQRDGICATRTGHRPSAVDKRLISIVLRAVWDCSIFLFIIFPLPYIVAA